MCWFVGLSVCWFIGLLVCWFVELVNGGFVLDLYSSCIEFVIEM